MVRYGGNAMPNTEVQCPNCGSFATRPRATSWWQNEKMAMSRMSLGQRQAFDNPKWVRAFRSGQVAAVCDSCRYEFDVNTPIQQREAGAANVATEKRTLAERLKDLVELRAAGLITEDEFRQKKEDFLRGL